MRSPSDGGSAAPPEQLSAPPFTGRVHYLVGGMLPASYREWVRADLTGRGWRHRQAARPVLLMLPFAIVFAILPGPSSLKVSLPLILLLCALVMGYATSDNFRNRRLAQHGLPRPIPAAGREDDDDDDDDGDDEDG